MWQELSFSGIVNEFAKRNLAFKTSVELKLTSEPAAGITMSQGSWHHRAVWPFPDQARGDRQMLFQ